jgi:ABC-2 type transport system permease protein
VQRAYFGALPDVALRSTADLLGSGFVTYTKAQQESLDAHFNSMTKELTESPERGGGPFDALLERETAVGAGLATSHVAYYAGAIAFLFLLFSAMHGALSFLDERDSGLLDRILAGPGGMGALIRGKFLFLVVQGALQVLLIFVVAWAFYGVALGRHFGAFALLTTAAALSAAGLALAVTLACRTRRQAQTISNVLILLLSAVGGSMVPRFLMPPALQRLGWLTPTTWAVEGYSAIFWHGAPIAAIALPVILLAGTGLAALAVARTLARRVERI